MVVSQEDFESYAFDRSSHSNEDTDEERNPLEDNIEASHALFSGNQWLDPSDFQESYVPNQPVNPKQDASRPSVKRNANYGPWIKHHGKECLRWIGILIIFPVAIPFGLSFGLLIYACNELVKAYQEDKDMDSILRRMTTIAPTLLVTSAAGYSAFACFSLLTGLTLSTGGFGLIVFAAVSLAASLTAFFTKLISNCAFKPYKLTEEEKKLLRYPGDVQVQIDARLTKIKGKGYTFFCSYTNDAVRNLRQEINHLKTYGIPSLSYILQE